MTTGNHNSSSQHAGDIDARGSAPAPTAVHSDTPQACRPSKSLRILFLGGTGFIGPAQVRAAVGRGHRVAVFSRGLSTAALPVEAEPLVGDRDSDLSAIESRDWDAVVDLATYGPAWIRKLGTTLRQRVAHYTFISTISVYDSKLAAGSINRQSPLKLYSGASDPYSASIDIASNYGALKALCEHEAEVQFPARTLILRPGYISGPGDVQGYLNYWAIRIMAGGEILAAGDPSMPIQFIDVRDLADFTIRMIERGATGIHNAVGPASSTSLGRLIHAASEVTSELPRVIWVEASWLAQQGKDTWQKVLFWTELDRDTYGPVPVDISSALANGLTTRSINLTLADALHWYQKQPPGSRMDVRDSWKAKEHGEGFDLVSTPWPVYLEREREILAAWRRRPEERRP
jgi:2'-hydroxyisoflavone reductase